MFGGIVGIALMMASIASFASSTAFRSVVPGQAARPTVRYIAISSLGSLFMTSGLVLMPVGMLIRANAARKLDQAMKAGHLAMLDDSRPLRVGDYIGHWRVSEWTSEQIVLHWSIAPRPFQGIIRNGIESFLILIAGLTIAQAASTGQFAHFWILALYLCICMCLISMFLSSRIEFLSRPQRSGGGSIEFKRGWVLVIVSVGSWSLPFRSLAAVGHLNGAVHFISTDAKARSIRVNNANAYDEWKLRRLAVELRRRTGTPDLSPL